MNYHIKVPIIQMNIPNKISNFPLFFILYPSYIRLLFLFKLFLYLNLRVGFFFWLGFYILDVDMLKDGIDTLLSDGI